VRNVSVPGTVLGCFKLLIVFHKPFLQRRKPLGPNVVVLVLEHRDDNKHLLLVCLRVYGGPVVGEVLDEVVTIRSAVS